MGVCECGEERSFNNIANDEWEGYNSMPRMTNAEKLARKVHNYEYSQDEFHYRLGPMVR